MPYNFSGPVRLQRLQQEAARRAQQNRGIRAGTTMRDSIGRQIPGEFNAATGKPMGGVTQPGYVYSPAAGGVVPVGSVPSTAQSSFAPRLGASQIHRTVTGATSSSTPQPKIQPTPMPIPGTLDAATAVDTRPANTPTSTQSSTPQGGPIAAPSQFSPFGPARTQMVQTPSDQFGSRHEQQPGERYDPDQNETPGIHNHVVQSQGTMADAVSGWGAMSPAQRAHALMGMPHDESGGVTTGVEHEQPYDTNPPPVMGNQTFENKYGHGSVRDASNTQPAGTPSAPFVSRIPPNPPDAPTATAAPTPEDTGSNPTYTAPVFGGVKTPPDESPSVASAPFGSGIAAPFPAPDPRATEAMGNNGGLLHGGSGGTFWGAKGFDPMAGQTSPTPESLPTNNPISTPVTPTSAQNVLRRATQSANVLDPDARARSSEASFQALSPPAAPEPGLPDVEAQDNKTAFNFPGPPQGMTLDQTGQTLPHASMYGAAAQAMTPSASQLFAQTVRANKPASPVPDEDEEAA